MLSQDSEKSPAAGGIRQWETACSSTRPWFFEAVGQHDRKLFIL